MGQPQSGPSVGVYQTQVWLTLDLLQFTVLATKEQEDQIHASKNTFQLRDYIISVVTLGQRFSTFYQHTGLSPTCKSLYIHYSIGTMKCMQGEEIYLRFRELASIVCERLRQSPTHMMARMMMIMAKTAATATRT